MNLAGNPPVRLHTNLVANPTCQADTGGWNIVSGLGGAFSFARVASGGPFGGSFARATWTAQSLAESAGSNLFNIAGTWGGQGLGATCAATPGVAYQLSIYVRPSKTASLRIQAQGITGSAGSGSHPAGPPVSCPANVWTRLTWSYTIESDVAALRLDVDHGDVITWNVGDTVDFACAAIIPSNRTDLPYFDGNSPGWQWIGAVGSSVSVGPA